MLASINAQNTKFSVTSPLTGLIFHASRGLTNLHIGKSVRDIYSIAFEFIIILYLIWKLDFIAVVGIKKRGASKYVGSAGKQFTYIQLFDDIYVLHYLLFHIFHINPPQTNHAHEYYGQPLYPLYAF